MVPYDSGDSSDEEEKPATAVKPATPTAVKPATPTAVKPTVVFGNTKSPFLPRAVAHQIKRTKGNPPPPKNGIYTLFSNLFITLLVITYTYICI